MKFYYVIVEDRITNQHVQVGSMLTIHEVRDLVSMLNHFNSTDIYIYFKEEDI